MSTWNNKREYYIREGSAMRQKMELIAMNDKKLFKDMEADIKNATYLTEVASDFLITELDISNEQWKESIKNARKIVNNYYKSLWLSCETFTI